MWWEWRYSRDKGMACDGWLAGNAEGMDPRESVRETDRERKGERASETRSERERERERKRDSETERERERERLQQPRSKQTPLGQRQSFPGSQITAMASLDTRSVRSGVAPFKSLPPCKWQRVCCVYVLDRAIRVAEC